MKLRDIHWSLYFLLWFCAVVAAGAVLGALAFPIGGVVLESKKTVGALALEGARRIGFIFFIWTPAIALVATVRRAYLKRHPSLES